MTKNLFLIFVAIFAIFSCKEKNNEILVSEVTLNKSTLTLDEGASDTITVTITPNNAENKSVVWSTSDRLVATVTEGVVSALKKGTATITVTSVDGKKTATCIVTVSEVPIPLIGVKEVALNKTTLSLVIGSTDFLVATITPDNATDKKVTWSTNNTAVAKVSEGKITAVAAGNATITVKTRDGKKTATCTVTVTKSEIPLTGIKLNKTTLLLKPGKTEMLSVMVEPENATTPQVKWETHSFEIATVNEVGKVTAVSEGHAIIRVTTADGKYSVDCSVTVEPTVTGIELNKTTLTLALREKETLIATITPAEVYNKKIKWTTSNSSKVVVSETGELTAVSEGTVIITAQADDGGKLATCEVTVVPPKIGDYYYSDDTYSTDLKSGKTPIGMIFFVNENLGKIMALNEPPANWNNGSTDKDGNIAWSTFVGEKIGASHADDGVKNMKTVVDWIGSTKNVNGYTLDSFPAFKWCAEYVTVGYSADRWYLPAHTELRQLYAGISGLKWVTSGADATKGEINDWGAADNVPMPAHKNYGDARNNFNNRLTASGVNGKAITLMNGDYFVGYWSSTESGGPNPFFIETENGAIENSVSKNSQSFFVRAIATFSLP